MFKKKTLLGYSRCGTKSKIDKTTKLKNKLRHRKTIGIGDVLIISPGVGGTRPFRVRAPLMKHLNRAMVVVVTAD